MIMRCKKKGRISKRRRRRGEVGRSRRKKTKRR